MPSFTRTSRPARLRALAVAPAVVAGLVAGSTATAPTAMANTTDAAPVPGTDPLDLLPGGHDRHHDRQHKHRKHHHRDRDQRSGREKQIDEARHIALNQIGDPYEYGAAGPRRFDCSGLIYYSYRKAGFHHVPRTSDGQADHSRRIKKKDLRRGDFMFFADGGGVYHAGIFLRWEHGEALMLHSPEEGERVHRENPWTADWYAGTLRGL